MALGSRGRERSRPRLCYADARHGLVGRSWYLLAVSPVPPTRSRASRGPGPGSHIAERLAPSASQAEAWGARVSPGASQGKGGRLQRGRRFGLGVGEGHRRLVVSRAREPSGRERHPQVRGRSLGPGCHQQLTALFLSLQITFYVLVKAVYTLGYSVSLVSLATGSIILCLFR